MGKIWTNIKNFLGFFGFNPTAAINNLRGLPFYLRDLRKLKKQMAGDKDFPFGKPCIMLKDRFAGAGILSGHYFHQDLYVARKILENKPIKHIDIGSSIHGFVAHVAVYRELEVFDVRPQVSKVKNIIFKQADMMNLPAGYENYCDSISSLHAIEHFGLGRYGDPIDYSGHLKGLDTIYKILQKGGKFYFAVPIGPQRIEFNGHRVFRVSYLLDLFKNKYTINSFCYVDDNGDFHENVPISTDEANVSFHCNYGLGIFELTKN